MKEVLSKEFAIITEAFEELKQQSVSQVELMQTLVAVSQKILEKAGYAEVDSAMGARLEGSM